MNAEISELYRALAKVSAKYLGKRFVQTSGDRDCKRQTEISGNRSYHLVGEAFDAQLVPYNREEQAWLGSLAEAVGFRWGGNFGKYDDVHFDNGYRKRGGSCPPRR